MVWESSYYYFKYSMDNVFYDFSSLSYNKIDFVKIRCSINVVVFRDFYYVEILQWEIISKIYFSKVSTTSDLLLETTLDVKNRVGIFLLTKKVFIKTKTKPTSL